MGIWGKRENELPKELQDLTPEELITAVNNSKRVGELQTELQTRDARLTEMQGTMDTMRSELDAIDGNMRRQQAAPAPAAPSGQPAQTAWEDDPDRAFQERLAASSAPRDAIAIQAGAIAAKLSTESQLRGMAASDPKYRAYPKLWEKYGNEIQQVMQQQNPATHVMPQTWMHAFTFVLGQHASELIDMAKEPNNPFFSEVPASPGPQPPAPPQDKLTPDEEAIARKMKIKPERYLAQRKSMTVVPETH